jgi:hypothetical protein
MKTFFVIGLDSTNYLGQLFKYTHDINKAYVFNTFEEAIAYEERNGNKIDGLTDIFKVQGSKVIATS